MTPSPRGKLADVPLAVRRLCSLLYRATRRQATAIDRLHVALDALAGGMDQLRDQVSDLRVRLDAFDAVEDSALDELAARVGQLEERT